MKKFAIAITIVVILIVIGVYLFEKEQYKEIKNEKQLPINSGTNTRDPNILYEQKTSGSGLCITPKGEGRCYYNTYLYNFGRFVVIEGWGTASPSKVTEQQFSKSQVEKVVTEIRNSGILNKDCGAAVVFDFEGTIYFNVDGITNEIEIPGCTPELKKILAVISTILTEIENK